MISINLNMQASASKIEGQILIACQKKLNTALRLAAPAIRRRVGEVCEELIKRTPEYISLIHGELMGEFGIPDAESRLDVILSTITRGVRVTPIPIKIVRNQFEGGMLIKMIRSDFEDILSLGGSSYISQPSSEEVPWLGWLIGAGDDIVVFSHKIIKDLDSNQKLRSRTGQALMVPGSGWRVPPEYSGTFENNFITRAFDVIGVETILAKIIEAEVQGRV